MYECNDEMNIERSDVGIDWQHSGSCLPVSLQIQP